MSTIFGSLAAAQVIYPHATSLTNELDWAALQGAENACGAKGGTVDFGYGRYFTGTMSLQRNKFTHWEAEHQMGLLGQFSSPTAAPAYGGTATGTFIWYTGTGAAVILPNDNVSALPSFQLCGCSIEEIAIYAPNGDCISMPNGAAGGFKMHNVGLFPGGKGIRRRGFCQDWDVDTLEIAGGTYGLYCNNEAGALDTNPSRLDDSRFKYVYVHGQVTAAGPSTTGTFTAGSAVGTLASGAGIEARNTMTIAGAGPAGAALTVEVVSVSGTTVLLEATVVTSVAGAAVTTTQGGIGIFDRTSVSNNVSWLMPRVVNSAKHGIYESGGCAAWHYDTIAFEGNGHGSSTYTPTTMTIGAGSKVGTVASAAGLSVGQTLTVQGASNAPFGADLYSVITAISGTTVTINDVSGLNMTATEVTTSRYSDMVFGGENGNSFAFIISTSEPGATEGNNNLRYGIDLSSGVFNVGIVNCATGRPIYDPTLVGAYSGSPQIDPLNPNTPAIGLLVRVSPYQVRSGVATLAAGTVTVSHSAVQTGSRIRLTRQPGGANPGAVYVSAIVGSTSFTITSTSGTDTGIVFWEIARI